MLFLFLNINLCFFYFQNCHKGKQASGYQASVLNHFQNNHSDCRVISQTSCQLSSPAVPYIVNWGCDDAELNSSAFNDVFIEDNYCTTENDYDSRYGGKHSILLFLFSPMICLFDVFKILSNKITCSKYKKMQNFMFYKNKIV